MPILWSVNLRKPFSARHPTVRFAGVFQPLASSESGRVGLMGPHLTARDSDYKQPGLSHDKLCRPTA